MESLIIAIISVFIVGAAFGALIMFIIMNRWESKKKDAEIAATEALMHSTELLKNTMIKYAEHQTKNKENNGNK